MLHPFNLMLSRSHFLPIRHCRTIFNIVLQSQIGKTVEKKRTNNVTTEYGTWC